MNSDQIFDVIESIAATSSKNEKQAIIARHAEDETFRKVLVLALDPLITFGLQDLPAQTQSTDAVFDDGAFQVLDRLATRQLSGNWARDEVASLIDSLSPRSAELLKRIIRKDLRAGFSESTVNKVIKGLIREFPYMRCSLPKGAKLHTWDWSGGVISQEKADGMFLNVSHLLTGEVQITSRQGAPFPHAGLTDLVADVQRAIAVGTQLHGEALVLKDGEVLPREISNGLMNHIASGGVLEDGHQVVFKVWDQIPLEAAVPKGSWSVPYKERLIGLTLQLVANPTSSLHLIDTRVVHSMSEAYLHCADLLAAGKEGTIIKASTAVWKDGTSKEQVKLKLEFVVDLRAVAIVPGRVATKNEGRPGSITCETSDGLLRVDVTVKNEAMRNAIEANPDEWLGKVYAVCANSVMEPSESNDLHSLFLPRFVEDCYRSDKSEADDLPRVFAQLQAAIDTAGQIASQKAA